MIVLVAAMGAITTSFFVLFVVMFIRRSQSMDIFHRLRRHYDANADKFKQTSDIVRKAHDFIERAAKPIADLNISKNLDFLLKQAGIPLLGAEFIVLASVCAVLGTIATYVVTFNFSIAPLAGVGIILAMILWVRMRIGRRRKAFTEQLGDCLTTVANALRAGYSFQQAMDVVAKEMEPPMSTEFERVTTDVAMGVTLEDALLQMNRRVGSPDFDLVVTAVLIQREIGGNLAQILDTISYTINERIRMKREINALTAQGRFSAWVLMILPVVVAAFCWIFNHDQMLIFVNEEIGRIALAAIIIMQIFGFIVIRRIVDIEL
ncbi:MAG: type II secretion system F family protein [Selenomonadaceae bacterium]|nr:type II secretion system F family protein [Selenomonadaceae bacterium]